MLVEDFAIQGTISTQKSPNFDGAEKSPTLPKRPPVSAAMKMEELNEFCHEEAFEGESILEYFDDEMENENLMGETDSFYFYEEDELELEPDDEDYFVDEHEDNDEQYDDEQQQLAHRIEQQNLQLPKRPQVQYVQAGF